MKTLRHFIGFVLFAIGAIFLLGMVEYIDSTQHRHVPVYAPENNVEGTWITLCLEDSTQVIWDGRHKEIDFHYTFNTPYQRLYGN